MWTLEGKAYFLPDGLTWEGIAAARKKWDISPRFAALITCPGAVGWGVPGVGDYQTVKGD